MTPEERMEAERVLNPLADLIDRGVPAGSHWGLFVLSPSNEIERPVYWVSNSELSSMVAMIKDWISRLERGKQ
jgi:hypothetical protein